MTLDELRRTVATANGDDWHELPGPSHLHTFFDLREGDAPWRVGQYEHHGRAVLKSNLDVGLAWGLPWGDGDNFSEPWTKPFADQSTSGHYADVLWRGQPVIREIYITVDGGRYALPLPAQNYEKVTDEDHVLMPYTITTWQYALIGFVHALGHGGHPYDSALHRAKIQIEQ